MLEESSGKTGLIMLPLPRMHPHSIIDGSRILTLNGREHILESRETRITLRYVENVEKRCIVEDVWLELARIG